VRALLAPVAGWDQPAVRTPGLLVGCARAVNPNAASAMAAKFFAIINDDQLNVVSTTASELLPST